MSDRDDLMEKDHRSGRMVGCCIKIMCLAKYHYSFSSFWCVRRLLYYHNKHPPLCTLQLSSKYKGTMKGKWCDHRQHFQHSMLYAVWLQKKTFRNGSVCVCVHAHACMPEGSTLKHINGRIGIQSFTKLQTSHLFFFKTRC
jgi:hypothetical protein